MLLNFETFVKCLTLISENFSFSYSEQYADMIYRSLRERIDNNNMRSKTFELCKECSSEEWHKMYGFRGKPPLADWLNYFLPKNEKTFIEVKEAYICEITGATLFRNKWVESSNSALSIPTIQTLNKTLNKIEHEK